MSDAKDRLSKSYIMKNMSLISSSQIFCEISSEKHKKTGINLAIRQEKCIFVPDIHQEKCRDTFFIHQEKCRVLLDIRQQKMQKVYEKKCI